MQQIIEDGLNDITFHGPVFSRDKKIYLTYGGIGGNELVVKTAVLNNESIVCELETYMKILSAIFLTKNTDIALVVKNDESDARALMLVNTDRKVASPLIFLPGICHVLGYTCLSVFLSIYDHGPFVSSEFAWEVKYADCGTDRYTYSKTQISDDGVLAQREFTWTCERNCVCVEDRTMHLKDPQVDMIVTFTKQDNNNNSDGTFLPFLKPKPLVAAVTTTGNKNNRSDKKIKVTK